MYFDDVLPYFVSLALATLGEDIVEQALFLRDARGKVTLILRSAVPPDVRAAFDARAVEALGSYVDEASGTPEELFDESLVSNVGAIRERVSLHGNVVREVWLLDRQIIGQDWLRPNFSQAAPKTPVLTFFSCKGGVGRSTALAVVASDLAGRGKNTMIIDLDLEAPGVGSILLASSDLPEWGVLDYLIEQRMGGVTDEGLEHFIAPSPLTAGRGLIEIMPAVGGRSRKAPAEVLPKLGRAYLDDFDESGAPVSYLDQVRRLVARLSARGRSDVILVDARAGLSESSAPAILGLGGDVLLFGVSTPQTIECYSYLLAHLGRFAVSPPDGEEWRLKLRMVHAKSGRSEEAWRPFRENCYEIFSDLLYEEDDGNNEDAFNFDIDDPEAPHYPWPIPFDTEYAEFDPTLRRSVLSREFYEQTFGSFTNRVYDLLFPESAADDE
jgi:hypothetical protein